MSALGAIRLRHSAAPRSYRTDTHALPGRQRLPHPVDAAANTGNALTPLGFLYDDPQVLGVCYLNGNPNLWGQECTLKVANPSRGLPGSSNGGGTE